MAEYTTVTLTTGVKDELSADMQESETWNEYLRRLQSETETRESPESSDSFSPNQLDQVRTLIEETTPEPDQSALDNTHSDTTDIDYDRIREIIREEVRRALEEIVR